MGKACVYVWILKLQQTGQSSHMVPFVWTLLIYTNSHIAPADYVHAFGCTDEQRGSFNRPRIISSALFFASVLAMLSAPDNDNASVGLLFTAPPMVNTQQQPLDFWLPMCYFFLFFFFLQSAGRARIWGSVHWHIFVWVRLMV